MSFSTLKTLEQQQPSDIQQQLADGILIARLWRSPRDKTRALEVSLRSFKGSGAYIDIRLFEVDQAGHMRPTAKGVTASIGKLTDLRKAVGDAHRRAVDLGLIMAPQVAP